MKIKKIITRSLLAGVVLSLSVLNVKAATVQIGGIDMDLDARINTITGASDSFLDDLTTNSYTFTSDEAVSIDISQGTIYGTKLNPIKAEYTNRNLIATNVDIINVAYNMQKKIVLDKYTFVNRVPESISIPVPMFIEESLTNPTGWNYTPPTPDGATNEKVTISDLRDKMGTGEYTYDSGSWKYLIRLNTTAQGVDATSQNEISWKFEAPFDTKYTVDIAAITEGGTPSIEGLSCGVTTLSPTILNVNNEYFKNGEINTSVDGGDIIAIGDIASLGVDTSDNSILYDGMRECGEYEDSYTGDYNPDTNYVVDYVNIDIYNPLTEELENSYENLTPEKANEIIASGLLGKTEIRVAYKKAPLLQEKIETPVETENPSTADIIITCVASLLISIASIYAITKVKKITIIKRS